VDESNVIVEYFEKHHSVNDRTNKREKVKEKEGTEMF
jgi:hypothetical protein